MTREERIKSLLIKADKVNGVYATDSSLFQKTADDIKEHLNLKKVKVILSYHKKELQGLGDTIIYFDDRVTELQNRKINPDWIYKPKNRKS